jgi:hypothetical protein
VKDMKEDSPEINDQIYQPGKLYSNNIIKFQNKNLSNS